MTIDIQAIRERVNKATPGPWALKLTRPWYLKEHPDRVVPDIMNDSNNPVITNDLHYDASQLQDWEFIAHARTDLPKALDVIEAMIEAKKNSDTLWEELLIAKEKELYNVKAEIERLRGALGWYAQESVYEVSPMSGSTFVSMDGGRRARKALAGDSA